MTQLHEDFIGRWRHTGKTVLRTAILRHEWNRRPGTAHDLLDVGRTAYGLRRAEVVVAEGGSVGACR